MKTVSPTEGITCRHGGLLPEAAGSRAKRMAVPPVVWEHLAAAENGRAAPKSSTVPNDDAAPAAAKRCALMSSVSLDSVLAPIQGTSSHP
jgi:hypothetical protein